MEQKEKEKVDRYQDLKRELQKLWDMKVKVVPKVIGALGTPSKGIKRRVKELGIKTSIEEVQKTVIMQSARILRNVLENRLAVINIKETLPLTQMAFCHRAIIHSNNDDKN